MSLNSNELRAFLDEYEKYAVNVLNPTQDEIRALFGEWKDSAYWSWATPLSRLPAPSPVHHSRTRVKRPESVVDKILRKPEMFSDRFSLSSIASMRDAVAGRVVVYFLANLPLIDREIRQSNVLELSALEPPIAYLSEEVWRRLSLTELERRDRDSGYASVHYIVRFRESAIPKEHRPWFEIQVRTLAEDLWAELEHLLGYKPNKRTSFAVRKQFKILSSQLNAIDEHFNLLYEELVRFQEEVTFRDNDPLNAENLPAVLSEIGVGCAQSEIDGLLKLLNSRGLSSVGLLREVASYGRLDLIRNTYTRVEGRAPRNFEIVASLAAARDLTETDRVIDAVKTQMDFLRAWDAIKSRK